MHKLYKKSEILFFVAWLVVYIVASSAFDSLSSSVGIEKIFTAFFHIIISVTAIIWLKKHDLLIKYGICSVKVPASKFLFYIPLAVIVSCNLWFGVSFNYPLADSCFYVISMVCVGFIEEFIFRGLLFRAMEKNGLKSAVIVSSVTFGIGHIIITHSALAE